MELLNIAVKTNAGTDIHLYCLIIRLLLLMVLTAPFSGPERHSENEGF